MEVKVITDSDLDGVSCDVLITSLVDDPHTMRTIPNKANEYIMSFIDKEVPGTFQLIISDLSISEETASRLNQLYMAGYDIKYFDHHRTSRFMTKYEWATVYEFLGEKKTCATELVWRYFKSKVRRGEIKPHTRLDVNEYIQVVDDYVECVRQWDTWDWINIDIKPRDLNTLLKVSGPTEFGNTVYNHLKDGRELISSENQKIIDIFEKQKIDYIKLKTKNVKFTTYPKYETGMNSSYTKIYRIGYVFAEEHASELGNYICKQYSDDIDLAAIINAATNVVSLRCLKSNIDVSKIAKDFGGGGHPQAAGFVYSNSIEHILLDSIFTKPTTTK